MATLAKAPRHEAIQVKNLKKTYRRRRHSVSLLHAHLVFCTTYRREVITLRAFEILRRSMRRTAQAIGIELVAIESDGDHVHLMIHYPPNLALGEIVRRLKGASSRHLRQRRLPEVARRLWGAHFWSPSYFVVSCGGAPLETVKAYVENQQSPERKRRPSTTIRKGPKGAPYPGTEVRGLRANL